MSAPAKRQGRPPAGIQLRRLLAMIPWLASRPEGATIEEIAEHFAVTPQQVEADLTRASMLGLPPYTPDELVEVQLGDRVTVRPGPVFRRPPKLTTGEGFAVLAAGKALQSVPGSDPDGALDGALAKLEAVLGDPDRIAVDIKQPPHLATVQRATTEGRRLRITYWSAWRDEASVRDLDPHVVFSRVGRWYVDGFDRHWGEIRRFRVDRIEAAEETGERFEPPGTPPPETIFDPPPDTQRVVVLVPPEGRWVIETYPVHAEEAPDGRLRVTFTVVGASWLERVLLRLGPDAEVVEPPEARHTGRDAARRLLARYDAG